MNARRVTLVDVAKRASVSVATVSRALNDDPQISKETRRHVRRIAKELKYVPNVTARNLVLQSSATLGLITPDVTDPNHGLVVTGFQQRASERGYSVVLSNGFWDADTERRAFGEFAAHRVAAVAVMGSVLPQRQVKRLLAPSPVLFVGSEHVPARGAVDQTRGCLRPNDRDGMNQVVEHLVERGYRNVAYVSGSWGATRIIRHRALVSALADRGLREPVVYRADEAYGEGLHDVVAQIGEDRPEVVVCYDDMTALRLIDELRVRGLRVPADMSVVGFDDIPFARISNPRLTTVSQSSDVLGRLTVDMLLSALEHGRLPQSQLMPVTLVVRETTPGPPSRTSTKVKRP